jgi:hypothetical protein
MNPFVVVLQQKDSKRGCGRGRDEQVSDLGLKEWSVEHDQGKETSQ